jgi:hypothetical protein
LSGASGDHGVFRVISIGSVLERTTPYRLRPVLGQNWIACGLCVRQDRELFVAKCARKVFVDQFAHERLDRFADVSRTSIANRSHAIRAIRDRIRRPHP